MSVATAFGLSIGNKVKYKVNMQKYKMYKKQYEEDRQFTKYFDKLHGKSLQDNLIDKVKLNLRVFFLIDT